MSNVTKDDGNVSCKNETKLGQSRRSKALDVVELWVVRFYGADECVAHTRTHTQ